MRLDVVKIIEILILITIAGFVSAIFELNILAKNIEKNKKKKNMFYISEALNNSICGFLLSLATMLVSDNIIVWIISDIIGSFLGTTSFKIASKILLNTINLFKNIDIGDMVSEIEKDKKEDTKTDESDKKDN